MIQLSASPKSVSLSVGTIHPTPTDLALFEGRQTDNFLGTIAPAAPPSDSDTPTSSTTPAHDTQSMKSLGVCFVSEGTFEILVDIVEVDKYGRSLPVAEKTVTSKVVKVIVHGEE